MVDVGVRDETAETSGALSALKQVALKTHIHSNEQLNFNMVSMSGGDMQFNYDKEKVYVKGYCLAREAHDMFNIMADVVTEPKTDTVAEIARIRCLN